MKKIFEYTKILIIMSIIMIGSGYLRAWNGASATAPNGNVAAPLNVGTTVQTKLGSLILNAASPIQNAVGLVVFGTTTFNGHVTIADGTQGSNKILTSDGNGNAQWASNTGSIGGGCYKIATASTGSGLIFAAWGNATGGTGVCTCASGYTPRISAADDNSYGAGNDVSQVALATQLASSASNGITGLMCVKN
jgi:hypothetical protein